MHIFRLSGRRLGRDFDRLWAAYAVSAYGSGFALGAFPLIAVLVLHANALQVSVLAAVAPAVGAALAVPLAPWVDGHTKRPVMIAADIVRCVAVGTVPLAYMVDALGYWQLVVVSAVATAAKIAFGSASGAYLKALVAHDDLLTANARFESTGWSSLAVGPPLGGAAIGLFGPVATVVADAASYLLSAVGVAAIRGREPDPQPAQVTSVSVGDLLDGWRHVITEPNLRGLYLNSMAVNGLIMATEPLLAVLLLRDLGFAPWQYGLAFAAPCVGGFFGSRLSAPAAARYGEQWVLTRFAAVRAMPLLGLAFLPLGTAGLVAVIGVELALILCVSLHNPVLATYRLQQTPNQRMARSLTAWSVGQQGAIAACTAMSGALADAVDTRSALLAVGLLRFLTPLLLPRPTRPRLSRTKRLLTRSDHSS